MSFEKPRKHSLAPQILETVSKFLPENNAEKPKGYPVSFSEFCASTNVREVTVKVIKRTKYKSYKVYLENEDCVRAQEYNFYIHFYKSKEARNCSPLCDIKVNDDCPEDKHKLVLDFCKNNQTAKKFPVSFEKFCKHTNCEDIVNETLKARGWAFGRNSSEWEKIARKLYSNFYTCKEKRKKYNVRIKPCTKTLKTQLLKFATDIELSGTEENDYPKPTKNTNSSGVPDNVKEPSPKRPRLNSNRNQQMIDCIAAVENKFPASYDMFLMHTNVKDLAISHLKITSKTSVNAFDVAEFTKKLYIEFYTRPRYENYLFNELFVRHNYADIITGLPTFEDQSGISSSTIIQKRTESTTEKHKVVIQSVEILKPLTIEPNHNIFDRTTEILPNILQPKPVSANQITNLISIEKSAKEQEKLNRFERHQESAIESERTCDDAPNITLKPRNSISVNNTLTWFYPLSFESFCLYSNLEQVVDKMLKERKGQNSVEYTAPIWLNIAREIYENFYKCPEKRLEYALTFKPMPRNIKRKILGFAFQTERKENPEEQSNLKNTTTDYITAAFLPSKQKSNFKEKAQISNQQSDHYENSEGNISITDKVNDDNLLDPEDPIDCALKSIFSEDEPNNNETVVHNPTFEENLSTSSSTTLQSTISNLPESLNQNQTSSGESIKPHQKLLNHNGLVTDFAHTELFHGLTQLQSQSLLQPSNFNTSTNPQETLINNFINMPNTQQQCSALLSNNNETSLRIDPLNNSFESSEIQSASLDCGEPEKNVSTFVTESTQPAPSSARIESHGSVDNGGNSPNLTKKGEEGLVDAKAELVPLKNLQFTIDESGNDFNVTAFAEEPVLLTDSQDINFGYMSTKNGQLERIFSHLTFASQDINNTIPVPTNDKTLICTEAQGLHRITSENLPEIQRENSNSGTIIHNFPNRNPAQVGIAARDLENSKKSQNEKTNHLTGITKKPVYRVVKSKNLAYDVPQILHDFRAIPIETGLVQKKPNTNEKKIESIKQTSKQQL